MIAALARLYPSLNRDLLFAGITLHDLGKTVELSGPVVPEYTIEVNYWSHISISQAMIKEMADKMNIEGEEVTLLQNIILSHHGKTIWFTNTAAKIKRSRGNLFN